MRINEHQKKGCNKVVDSKKNPLKLKLYPPLKNVMEGVHLVNGENIIEYRVKVNAFLSQGIIAFIYIGFIGSTHLSTQAKEGENVAIEYSQGNPQYKICGFFVTIIFS